MGNCECGRLKGNPCGPLRPNTINVTMPHFNRVFVSSLLGEPEQFSEHFDHIVVGVIVIVEQNHVIGVCTSLPATPYLVVG